MSRNKRPVLKPPVNSILDEITANSSNQPPGQPPFARVHDPDQEATAPPAAEVVPAQPEPAHESTRPAPARTTTGRKVRSTTSNRARPTAGIPEPPPGYIATRKPLQVYVPGEDHWHLKWMSLVRGTDMSKIVAALVSAFVYDPDMWTALIARAEGERVSLGELLAPHLARALDEIGGMD